MPANVMSILKNYKSFFEIIFYPLFAAFCLISFANTLIYRTGIQFTLLEYLVIGLLGSVSVLLYNFRNTLKSSFIQRFLSLFCFFMAYDAFRQIFSTNEYHLLSAVGASFVYAILMAYWSERSNK